MPEIIDNIKVGQLIKELLKEHGMTQEDLARELSISKSAVSQNLNGKSSFDIQNLITIAKLFDISLEKLLVQRSDSNKEITSEYERLVKRGVDAFSNVAIENMNINVPDLYGNVLVEYVISYDDVNLFKLLHMSNVKLVDDTHHKARQVYNKIIRFALHHRIDGVKRYFDQYIRLYHGLFFLEDFSKDIWTILNEKNYQGFVLQLFTEPLIDRKRIKFIEVKRKKHYLSKEQWIDVIGRFYLDNILQTILSQMPLIYQYNKVMKVFIKYNYHDGIAWYLERMAKNYRYVEVVLANVQQATFLLAKANLIDYFKKAVDKGLFDNINTLMTDLLVNQYDDCFNYCVEKLPHLINFKMLGQVAVEANNVGLLKRIIDHFKQNDLNYLLSIVHENDSQMALYLFQQGALFDVNYYNATTMHKVNQMIRLLQEGKLS